MDKGTLILAATEQLQNLDEALRWALGQTPRVTPVDVVIQDEYTHDVILRVTETTFLVFDTS